MPTQPNRYMNEAEANPVLDRACRAASYAGHAAAMLANLAYAGMAERSGLWDDEMAVWQRRKEAAIMDVRLRGDRDELTTQASQRQLSAVRDNLVLTTGQI